jgi:phosphoglycerate dehydrogenase-like enzyme
VLRISTSTDPIFAERFLLSSNRVISHRVPTIALLSKLCLAEMAAISVGIIGMGDMGKLYARRFSEAGWK